MAEGHSAPTIYLADPCPNIPERCSLKGKAPTLRGAQVDSLKACQWTAEPPASAGRRLSMREGEKGHRMAEYLAHRVRSWTARSGSVVCPMRSPLRL